MITRRTFVAGAAATLVAALLTAPHLALAQESPRIAIVNATRPVEELTSTGHPMYIAFHDELALRGYVEGETVEIERWSGRDWADRDELASAVVASAPDLIYAASGAAIGPHLARATQTWAMAGFSTEPGSEIEGKRLQLIVGHAYRPTSMCAGRGPRSSPMSGRQPTCWVLRWCR